MNYNLQEKVFGKILECFPKRSAAVDELSTLLGVGKDAIYRRFRGDTLVTPDELFVLAKKYSISLDALIYEKTDTVFFRFNPFSYKVNSFQDYLNTLVKNLARLNVMPGIHIRYASSEIPFFYYAYFPELISFKLYIFGRTIWNFDYLNNRSFDFDIVSYPTIRLTEEMLDGYRRISTTELWNLNIMDNTLNQIEYHVNSGGFRQDQDAILLYDKLLELTNHMEFMVMQGRKCALNDSTAENGGDLNLYHNEMLYTNNTILVETEQKGFVYTTFASPNFLISGDNRMYSFATDWFNKLMQKASPLSTNAEKSRKVFFNKLRKKIENAKMRIILQIEIGE